jgi:hypothetical protein
VCGIGRHKTLTGDSKRKEGRKERRKEGEVKEGVGGFSDNATAPRERERKR